MLATLWAAMDVVGHQSGLGRLSAECDCLGLARFIYHTNGIREQLRTGKRNGPAHTRLRVAVCSGPLLLFPPNTRGRSVGIVSVMLLRPLPQ
jgi:hypothetical protein